MYVHSAMDGEEFATYHAMQARVESSNSIIKHGCQLIKRYCIKN